MDSQIHDARDTAGPPPLSPLLPRIYDVFERLVGNGDTSLDLTELQKIAELSYECSCPEIVLALTQCAERSPESRLILAKTLTALGHLLVAGSEELLAAVNAVFESFRARVDCILAGNAPDNTAETMSFIQERANAITELLGDQSLLSQTRRGTALVLPHILRTKDPRAGFAIGMTADSEAPVFDTSPSGFLKYRREFASMDITDQVSYQDIASVTSSHLSEIHHGWWSKAGDLEGRVKVALKVVVRYPEIARGKEIKRYADEMSIWRKLHHDNILPLYGVCWLGNNSAPALVSPWCDLGDINQYVRSSKRERRDIDGLKLEMFHHVLQGLKYLHENRIIHGDIKGANVLVSAQGVARLCDFGLASALDNSGSLSSSSKTPGTWRWMAPELLKGTRTIHVTVVDIQSGSIVANYHHGFDIFRHAPVEAVAFSACGSTVASSSKGTMLIYNVATKHFVQPGIQLAVGEPGEIAATHAIAFAPDGKTIATGSDDGCVRIWDATGTWKSFPKQASAAPKRKSQLAA